MFLGGNVLNFDKLDDSTAIYDTDVDYLIQTVHECGARILHMIDNVPSDPLAYTLHIQDIYTEYHTVNYILSHFDHPSVPPLIETNNKLMLEIEQLTGVINNI